MASSRPFPAAFVNPWIELLRAHQAEQLQDFPNYYAGDPESLITTSSPQALYVGTGQTIFRRGILPAILGAESSIHFVTCYWAASPSLAALSSGLSQLAASRRRGGTTSPPLRVSVGFSSRGLLQKLFHTSSTEGEAYPPSRWAGLGLPDEGTLAAGGIQLTVKSLFMTPISVMHPKYVIVDGKRALLPSCNVSWEEWFEGCVEVEGDVVTALATFHQRVWGAGSGGAGGCCPDPASDVGVAHAREEDGGAADAASEGRVHAAADSETGSLPDDGGTSASATRSRNVSTAGDVDTPVPTILLPSPHHRNPRFSFFPLLSHSDPPMTPLNAALLTLFANARRDITILTPNVTSWPVLEALLEALARGVNVQIRTNRRMMLIEQLLTAGTTTGLCLNRFIRRYKKLRRRRRGRPRDGSGANDDEDDDDDDDDDVEAQPASPGTLEIMYYRSWGGPRGGGRPADEPVASHFKMTLVDGEYLVLGSGNMDRASWWTSQELGLLVHVPGTDWHALWDGVLDKRMEVLYRSP
ncbi:hypothetical protein E4U41_007674 [Claviceps citrina]|nr:hypothetical protein E4U41_007674 [Claviceps citrina]